MNLEKPPYKLYPLWSIGALAAGGGIFVGALMMALNYRRLGQTQFAMQTVAVGMTGGLIVLIAYMCAGMPKSETLVWTAKIAQGIIAYLIARKLQSDAIKHHISCGGIMADSILDLLVIAFVGILAFVVTITGTALVWEVGKYALGYKG